jgi:predicted NBD/HSP70 family sugar kinase
VNEIVPALTERMANLDGNRGILRELGSQGVIDVLMRQGASTRVELAQRLGLSKQTISAIVRDLEHAGWVAEVGQTRGGVGRRAVRYALRADAAHVVGVDLGGTRVRAAVADLVGRVVAEEVVATEPHGGEAVADQIAGLCRSVAREAGVAWTEIHAVVVGSPGVVQAATGVVVLAPQLPGFDRLPLGAVLGERLERPVRVENDANLAAVGESWQGSARGVDDFVFVAIGNGIGMGLVLDGELRRGATGQAGEIGFLPLGADPCDPGVRTRGALEAAAGAAAIAQRFTDASGRYASLPAILELAAGGNPEAVAAVDGSARLIAAAVLSVAAVTDPALVVLGGGLGTRAELLDPVRRWLAEMVPNGLEVASSALGERATLVGAVGVALREAHEALFAPTRIGEPLALPLLGQAAAVGTVVGDDDWRRE